MTHFTYLQSQVDKRDSCEELTILARNKKPQWIYPSLSNHNILGKLLRGISWHAHTCPDTSTPFLEETQD